MSASTASISLKQDFNSLYCSAVREMLFLPGFNSPVNLSIESSRKLSCAMPLCDFIATV
jgi:hypothetical protein